MTPVRSRRVVDVAPAVVKPEPVARLTTEALMPEKRLVLAILTEAIATYRRCAHARSNKGRRLFREAAHWFASEATDLPFAFVSVCDVLGLDPDAVRSCLDAESPAPGIRAAACAPDPDAPLRRTG
jgi:hypothetical protein